MARVAEIVTRRPMMPAQAMAAVRERFPFAKYLPAVDAGHLNIAGTVLRHLRPGARVLDFGCGPCDKTAVIQGLGFQCTGFDELDDPWHGIEGNKEKILTFAREFGIVFVRADGGRLPFSKESFDLMMLHDVLEHLHDSPRELLNDLLECVKPGGYLFVTVPNAVNIRKRIAVLFGKSNLPSFVDYYWYPGRWRGHVREYTKGDLLELANCLDLEVVELRSCHNMLDKVPRRLRPFYLAITVLFTGWRDSWLLLGRKRAGWRARRMLRREEFERLYQGWVPFPG